MLTWEKLKFVDFFLKNIKKASIQIIGESKSQNFNILLVFLEKFELQTKDHWRQSLFNPKVQTLKPNQWETFSSVRIKKHRFLIG
jgi:hypothetical protein